MVTNVDVVHINGFLSYGLVVGGNGRVDRSRSSFRVSSFLGAPSPRVAASRHSTALSSGAGISG
jgi:hypothetical protein